MIRRLNFTGRRTISRSRITIRLESAATGAHRFTAEYDLTGLDFAPEACVYIEAYNAVSYMRFDFGTVGEMRLPKTTRLTEVTPHPRPRFRLKLVERPAGLLLGVADPIIPLRAEDDTTRRQPLLPVDFCDLGERVWRLDLTDWPVLELNHRLEGVTDMARAGEDFLALVYPEVIRRLIHEVVIVQEQSDPDFDDSDWGCLWLRYVCGLAGVSTPPEGLSAAAKVERELWVEEAVQGFCRVRETRRRYQEAIDRASGAASA